METEIFVDTSGLFALLVPTDVQHSQAQSCFRSLTRKRRRFVTTDYVIDETATLFKARNVKHHCRTLFEQITQSQACVVELTDAERFESVQKYFLKHLDQDWSFTDCLSFCVMKDRRIKQAFTKDHHFAEVGFEVLLK